MIKIPEYVKNIISKLNKAGFEAYIVGGCVRDLLMASCASSTSENKLVKKGASEAKQKKPKDWDVTTNAKPDEILKVFSNGRYENKFGTVIVNEELGIRNKELGIKNQGIEITTYRSEHGYADRRHPDKVVFEEKLEKDLERRDFTINAMAIQMSDVRCQMSDLKNKKKCYALCALRYAVVDLFGGEKDIKKKIIRAVGEPIDRFKEDALRMMRAIRFACQLRFEIEPKTERAIKKMAGGIKFVSNERIRDELIKILKSKMAYDGIILLHKNKLLQYIMPELEYGINIDQSRHHTYTVFKHLVLSLKYCPSKDWRVRFACLCHDIAKPQTKKFIKGIATFYNHDIIGAKITIKIMQRLKFSQADIKKIAELIRNHMFYYNVDEVTASSVRRLIYNVGEDNLKDLIDLRVADRLGSGVPKAKPYKLRHLEYMMKKVRKDPLSVKMLKINGDDLIKLLNIKPSPKIGAILDVLLSKIIEDPKLNNKKYLEKKSKELNNLELEELRYKAKEKIEEKKMEDDEELKKKFWVK